MKPTSIEELKNIALQIPEYGMEVRYRNLADRTSCREETVSMPHMLNKKWYTRRNSNLAFGDSQGE